MECLAHPSSMTNTLWNLSRAHKAASKTSWKNPRKSHKDRADAFCIKIFLFQPSAAGPGGPSLDRTNSKWPGGEVGAEAPVPCGRCSTPCLLGLHMLSPLSA